MALNQRQQSALTALVGGATVVDAAAAARVHRNTVGRWLTEPDFLQALTDAVRVGLRGVTARSAGDVDDALAVLRDLMTDQGVTPAVRLRAAATLLDARLRLLDTVAVDAPVGDKGVTKIEITYGDPVDYRDGLTD